MKLFIVLVSLACVAGSVLAAIHKMPFGKQDPVLYVWRAYPRPEQVNTRSLAEVIDFLSENESSPLQTMLLIYQLKHDGMIFEDLYAREFGYLNEYPQYKPEGECYKEELEDKTSLCSHLESVQDGSLLYKNLHHLCVDLKAKITTFCADKLISVADYQA